MIAGASGAGGGSRPGPGDAGRPSSGEPNGKADDDPFAEPLPPDSDLSSRWEEMVGFDRPTQPSADAHPSGAHPKGGGHDRDVEPEEEEADLLDPLVAVQRERDEYLDSMRHLQADFANYRKRMEKLEQENRERAAEGLVEKLLPVLDIADLAMTHADQFGEGQVSEEVKQVWSALLDVLEKEGLKRIDGDGEFDPHLHDAVAHEPADRAGPPTVDILRSGYMWKGRVLRPAMVRVKG
ncbi:MAG: nucleotide exchange factor GrpE [Acidimicrobiales bacterium]